MGGNDFLIADLDMGQKAVVVSGRVEEVPGTSKVPGIWNLTYAASSCDVQLGQRLALRAICERQ